MDQPTRTVSPRPADQSLTHNPFLRSRGVQETQRLGHEPTLVLSRCAISCRACRSGRSARRATPARRRAPARAPRRRPLILAPTLARPKAVRARDQRGEKIVSTLTPRRRPYRREQRAHGQGRAEHRRWCVADSLSAPAVEWISDRSPSSAAQARTGSRRRPTEARRPRRASLNPAQRCVCGPLLVWSRSL